MTLASTTETLTFEARLKAALKEIRAAGVRARQNVSGCCRSCIGEEALGLTKETEPTTPYVWTYGGQGGRYTWIEGLPFYADKARHRWGGKITVASQMPRSAQVKAIYFNHGGPGIQAATVAAETFRKHGLDVEWDGTEHQTVTVRTPFFDAQTDRV